MRYTDQFECPYRRMDTLTMQHIEPVALAKNIYFPQIQFQYSPLQIIVSAK